MPEFHENGTKIEGMAMRIQQVDGEYRVVLSEEAMKAQRLSVWAENNGWGLVCSLDELAESVVKVAAGG